MGDMEPHLVQTAQLFNSVTFVEVIYSWSQSRHKYCIMYFNSYAQFIIIVCVQRIYVNMIVTWQIPWMDLLFMLTWYDALSLANLYVSTLYLLICILYLVWFYIYFVGLVVICLMISLSFGMVAIPPICYYKSLFSYNICISIISWSCLSCNRYFEYKISFICQCFGSSPSWHRCLQEYVTLLFLFIHPYLCQYIIIALYYTWTSLV